MPRYTDHISFHLTAQMRRDLVRTATQRKRAVGDLLREFVQRALELEHAAGAVEAPAT
jgi:hypothetical protein